MGSLSPDSARAPGWLRPAWTPVKPPCHGLRCRRLVHPTRRLSTKVFLPTSPYPPSFQPPTYPTSFKRSQFPTQSSFEPPPYPLSFTTSCFHEFGRIRTYPGLSHIQDVSRESRRMSSKEKRRL